MAIDWTVRWTWTMRTVHFVIAKAMNCITSIGNCTHSIASFFYGCTLKLRERHKKYSKGYEWVWKGWVKKWKDFPSYFWKNLVCFIPFLWPKEFFHFSLVIILIFFWHILCRSWAVRHSNSIIVIVISNILFLLLLS